MSTVPSYTLWSSRLFFFNDTATTEIYTLSLHDALPISGCRSVVAVALAYARDDDPSWAPVARYARGRDYHDVMRPRLLELAESIRQAAGGDVRCRAAVDTSALLERDLAARAGLGWIGKNTNLLDPSIGSDFFIGGGRTDPPRPSGSPPPPPAGSPSRVPAAA